MAERLQERAEEKDASEGESPRGRFVVGRIPDPTLSEDMGVEQGDEILAPEGFPEDQDADGALVEQHRVWSAPAPAGPPDP